MVENVEYIALAIVDNINQRVYSAKAPINLRGITQNVSYSQFDGKFFISNTQYNDGWKKNSVLPIDSLLKFKCEDIEYALNALRLQGKSWQEWLINDVTVTFQKGSSADSFRIKLFARVGNGFNAGNSGVDVRLWHGTSDSGNPTMTLSLSNGMWDIWQGQPQYPYYRRVWSADWNEDYLTFNLVQVYENGTIKTFPAFEVNARYYGECHTPYNTAIDYNIVCNNPSLLISDRSTEHIDTTQPYPPAEDEGGDGQGQTDEGSTPDPQTDNDDLIVNQFVGNGFLIPYLPTNSTLDTLGSTLWTDNFMQRFINKGIKFTDGIIDLFMIPLRWNNLQSANLNICGVDMGIITNRATSMFQYVQLGTIDVPTKFGSFVDYRGYSTLKIYLPCIGFRTLNINDYMGKKIKLEYKVCVLDGSFVANVFSIDGNMSKITESFNGNCALHMPVSSGNYNMSLLQMQYYPPLAIARRAFGQDNPDVHNSGNLSGTSAYLGTMTPYLVIDVPKMQVPQALPSMKGYMSHCMAKLQDLHGYTEVKEIHLDVKGMTEEEKIEMLDILRSGIVI